MVKRGTLEQWCLFREVFSVRWEDIINCKLNQLYLEVEVKNRCGPKPDGISDGYR